MVCDCLFSVFSLTMQFGCNLLHHMSRFSTVEVIQQIFEGIHSTKLGEVDKPDSVSTRRFQVLCVSRICVVKLKSFQSQRHR